MPTKRVCACGQSFSSEGEQSRHQLYCDEFKRRQTQERLVHPLQDELARIQREVSAISGDLTAAFGHLVGGNVTESIYFVDLAHRSLEHHTRALQDLADRTAEAAKNRYAIVNRLRTELTALVETFQRYDQIIANARTFLQGRR